MGRGRPKLQEDEQKNEQVFARVTMAEKELFLAIMDLEGTNATGFLRTVVIQKNREGQQKYSAAEIKEKIKARRKRLAARD